ncbi:MAG: phage tail tape measure protein [Lachnospirales bacterium]
MVDDKFKIILSPTFEFNKEQIKKEVGKIKLPNINIVGDLDSKSTRININEKIKNLKLNKVRIDFKFTLVDFSKSANEKISLLKFKKAKVGLALDIDKNNKDSINSQIETLKLKKVKLQFELDIKGSKEYINEQIKNLKLNKVKLDINNKNYSDKDIDNGYKEQQSLKTRGKELKLSGDNKINYNSSTEELEKFAKSQHQNFEKITALKTRIQDLNNAQKQFTVSVKTGKGQLTEYTYTIDKASNKVFELGERTRAVNITTSNSISLINQMAQKVWNWNIATTAVYKSLEFFQHGIQFIIDLDTSLTEVALVTGQNREEVEGLKEEYLALAEATKKTITEISKLNVELVRQGLSQEETQARMDTILKLSAVGGMDSNDTLSIITSSVNALGEEAKRTADILVYADNASASSIGSIGTAMTKVASTAKTSGVSIEQLVGQVSTLIDVTQEAPETLGNSLKSMMARFSKINELGEINEEINDVEKAFRQVGIAFKDTEGQIRPFYDLMSDMAKEWDTLDKNTQSMVATLSAGTQQQNRFLVLMQNWDRVQKMTSELENNSEGSLDKGYSVWTESLQADINDLKIAFEELWMTMLDEGQISPFINALTGVINVINNIAEQIDLVSLLVVTLSRKFIPVDAIMKSFFKGIALGTNSITKLIFGLDKTGTSMNHLDKIMSKTIHRWGNYINRVKVATKETWSKSMADKTATVSQRVYNATINSSVVGLKALTLALKSSKIAVMGLKAVSTFGLSLIADALITGVFSLFNKTEDVSSNISEITNNFKDLSSTYQSNIKSLKEIEKEFEKFNSIVGENNDLTKLSTEEKERYLEISQQIADIAPEFVSYWDAENGAMIKYGTTIDEIIKSKKELYQIEKSNLLASVGSASKESLKLLKEYSEEIKNAQNQIETIKNGGINPNSYYGGQGVYNPVYENALKTINDKNATEEEKNKANAKKNELDAKISEQTAKIKSAQAKINLIINDFKNLFNINITDYFNTLDTEIPNNLKYLISSTANKFLENDIKENPNNLQNVVFDATAIAYSLKDYSEKIKENLNDLTPNDLTDNVDGLKKLEEELINLGLSSDEASNFVNILAIQTTGLGINAENTQSKIAGLTEQIKSNQSEINKLQEIYKKASTHTLTFEETTDFIEKYPETIEKINQGMETQNAIREVSLAQIDNINNKSNNHIELLQKENQERKKILLDEQKRLQNTLKTLEEKGNKETSLYRQVSEELKKIEEEFKNVDDTTKNTTSTLNVLNKVSQDFFDKEQFETIDEQFKNATDNISKYKDMLNTLDREGISGNLLKTILSDYPDLLMFIDDEIGLRETLNSLIIVEEEIQKESYKLKLMYNENFYKNFLANNKDLVDNLAKNYNIDLQNFKNASQAKEAISNELAKKIFANTKMTYSQAVSKYSDLGYDELNQELESVNNRIETLKNQQNNGYYSIGADLSDALAEKEYIENQIKWQKPFNFELESAVGNINWNKFNANTSSGTSSNGSKSKKTMIDLVELEKEQYLKLNKALEKNNRLRDKNNQLMEYAYGSDKIKLLDKENELISQRQQLYHQLANKYREEQSKLKKELSKTIGMNSEDEGMDNFTVYMTNKENEINALIKKINATTNEKTVSSLTEQKDKIQKEVDKLSEQYKRYIEITFNTIPDLQEDYTNAIFEKFDNMVEAMKIKLEKYEKEVSRLNVLKDLSITGKVDNTSELKRELEIHKEISAIYLNELSVTKQKAKETQDEVTRLQNKLNSIKDKSSNDYKNAEENLIRAKFMADEALALYESNLESYADVLNSKVDIEIQLLDKLREKTKESLQDLRKEVNEFTFDNFNNSLKEIELALNKIDGIFIKNPSYTLDTSDAKDNIKDVSKTIEQIRKKTDRWKDSLEKVKKSNKSNKEIIEDIKTITKELIETENKLNEEIAKKNQEIENLRLEYQQIEDSLQNQIDLKQEELEKIQEEFEHEQKINSLIEKRLQLLRALDDTSHMYVTGQGTVEWTYDKSAVNDLLQQIANEDKQNEQDKIVQEMQDEVDKMVENLETTKEIHQQNLAVNEAQLEQLEQEKEYIGNIIESSFESIDESFNNMVDKYIDTMNTQFEKNTGVLIDIYNILKENVGSKGFNYKNLGVSEISVNKNEENLSKIAKNYGVDINKLLELNKDLNINSILNFGQKIKIPTFGTGGYTGNFGNEGKLAVLHQKELVLNQNDTKNILNIVDIARNIIGSLNSIKLNTEEKNIPDVIHIENINFPQVNNVNQFANELQRFARGGMGRLS